MRRPYGLILDSECLRITRAVLQGDDRVVIQTLTVAHEVTLSLTALRALTDLLERADVGDAVLAELKRVEALTVMREPGKDEDDD